MAHMPCHSIPHIFLVRGSMATRVCSWATCTSASEADRVAKCWHILEEARTCSHAQQQSVVLELRMFAQAWVVVEARALHHAA